MMYWLLTVSNAMAAGGHHGDAHGIPWSTIFVQTLNLGVLLTVLYFALRHSVRHHFEQRAKGYEQLVERAEQARLQAEQGRQTIKERLARLEASADETVNQARAEANELRSRMLAEAKVLAEKLEQEAHRTVAVELEKAKAELRRTLLEQALAQARENLKKDLGSNEQKKLQNEFVEKIEVVCG